MEGCWKPLGLACGKFESQDGSKLDLGGLLGRSGRPLGPSRNQTEGQDGSKLGPKMDDLGVQKSSKGVQRGRFWDLMLN